MTGGNCLFPHCIAEREARIPSGMASTQASCEGQAFSTADRVALSGRILIEQPGLGTLGLGAEVSAVVDTSVLIR